MDVTGEQLHPNWQALATVHIPLKRFIRAGTIEAQTEISNSAEQYDISGVKGDEIREFYRELVSRESEKQNKYFVKKTEAEVMNKKFVQSLPAKAHFKSKLYFRLAMENKVDELKQTNFEGQNINICDQYGWTALMMASCEGAYEAVEFLLKLGVDRHIKDKIGRTAKDLALKKGHLNIVGLLEKTHIDIKHYDKHEKIEEKNEIFYCEICQQNFNESSKNQHYTSTLHQFSIKSNLPVNKLQRFNIPTRNKGLQLMVKQGWDKESGLGPSQSGRLYPVKTVMRKQRSGLGIDQEPARVTHFEPYDCKSVQRRYTDGFKKKRRNRNDIKREKLREWKRDKRLRNELN